MERLGATEFEGDRLLRPGNYVVCFAADWCGFCIRFLPQFGQFESELSSRLAVANVTDESSPLWEAFRIEVVPLLVGFRDGLPVWRIEAPLGVGLGTADLDRMKGFETPDRLEGARGRG